MNSSGMKKMTRVQNHIEMAQVGRLEHLEINEGIHVVLHDSFKMGNTRFYSFARPVNHTETKDKLPVYLYTARESMILYIQGRPQISISSARVLPGKGRDMYAKYKAVIAAFKEDVA
jgi:hypothetical protein